MDILSNIFEKVKSEANSKLDNTKREAATALNAGAQGYTQVKRHGLSNAWYAKGKDAAYSQAQDIADNVIDRVRSNSKRGLVQGSTAKAQDYQQAVQQHLSGLKSKAVQAISDITKDSPNEVRAEIGAMNTALSDLKKDGVIPKSSGLQIVATQEKGEDGQIIYGRDYIYLDKNGVEMEKTPEVADMINQELNTISAFTGLDDYEMSGIATRKGIAGEKGSGLFSMKTVITLGAVALGAYGLDQVVFQGAGFDKLTSGISNLASADGLSSLYNNVARNPYDTVVDLVDNLVPHDIAKIITAVAMGMGTLWGAAYMTKEHGGLAGLATGLGLGAGAFALAKMSGTDVNWEDKFSLGPQAKLINDYFPNFSAGLS